ncbi:MAG: sulfatase-like hydrolase/transferase, partial [Verrucomicrobiales bacterium]|nr:sulfatase-like hydrolase/transferase [Verrucomicrobiales bacterium]
WSDHGYHLGEHHLWQKRTLFDESSRAPLIIVAPQIPAAARGQTCHRVVEFIDIYPTLASLAGIPPAAPLPGHDLRPLLQDPQAAWPHPAFTQILRPFDPQVMGRAITTERWRYIEWNGGEAGSELYDHLHDPRELTNLANDPQRADLIQRLRAQFADRARATPPPPSVPVHPHRL